MKTSFLIPLVLCCFLRFPKVQSLSSIPTQPMNCTDTTRLCTSFLAFKPQANQSFGMIQSMFDVLPQDVTVEGNEHGYVFIKKNCSCLSTAKIYATNTTFTVRSSDGYVYDIVTNEYDGIAIPPNTTRMAKTGAVVSLRLFCGCSSGLWNYLMSYVMKEGDTVESLSSRFGVSMDSIERVNGIANPDNVTVGALFYIPLNSVPGKPYPMEISVPPAPVPAPSADILPENQASHKAQVQYGWIIGGIGIGLAVIVFCVVLCVALKSSSCFNKAHGSESKDTDGKSAHKFQILRKPSFCCASGRYMCCKSIEGRPTNKDSANHQISIPKVIGTGVFDIEKPVVFTYEEIVFATDGFSDSALLGHGTYGSVYYANLRDQEVAIKRMTATKTREFMAELNVLCKVHHTNLVELIGYAASADELFLIYEHAQRGSLKSHLHDPQSKGHTPLSWIMRVQIVLDASRGLEYIHEHTKTHYVHRDIKTSNVLLDDSFRAKVMEKLQQLKSLAHTVI